jgi:hypothetical protein
LGIVFSPRPNLPWRFGTINCLAKHGAHARRFG